MSDKSIPEFDSPLLDEYGLSPQAKATLYQIGFDIMANWEGIKTFSLLKPGDTVHMTYQDIRSTYRIGSIDYANGHVSLLPARED